MKCYDDFPPRLIAGLPNNSIKMRLTVSLYVENGGRVEEKEAAGLERRGQKIKNPRTTSGGFYLPNLYLKVDCYSRNMA